MKKIGLFKKDEMMSQQDIIFTYFLMFLCKIVAYFLILLCPLHSGDFLRMH